MAYDLGTLGKKNAKLGERGVGENMQMLRQGIGAFKPDERQHAGHSPTLGYGTGGDQQYRGKVFKYPSGRQGHLETAAKGKPPAISVELA